MSALDFLTRPLPVAELAAQRQVLLDSGERQDGDLSLAQEDELSALEVAIAAGAARSLADAAVQLEIVASRMDLMEHFTPPSEGDAKDMWDEMCAMVGSVRAVVRAKID